MDLFTRWSQRIRDIPFPVMRSVVGPVAENVSALRSQYLDLWWSRGREFPEFQARYQPRQQADNEKRLDAFTSGLIHEIKHMPSAPEDRQAWQDRLRPALVDFGRMALNLEQRHIDFIQSSGMIEASQEFARMARRFDAQISADDIFQAGRNVMTMNFLQLLLGLPVEITPAVFAYSMLYPYSDNYLDDPATSPATKLAFNHRFQRRLRGEDIRPANDYETRIWELTAMIELQWDRARWPQVYESLLAIHTAQAESLRLVGPGLSPFEVDVLGISFEKGGTSVLADGYLVAGVLSAEQAAFMFGYGAFTQLMDDLEDIEQDLKEKRATIFTQSAKRWPLDNLTNRMFHFGRAIFGDLSAFSSPAAVSLEEITARGMDPVMIDIIGRASAYYSRDYLREIEHSTPFRMASVRLQRKKVERQKINIGKLIETML